MRNRKKPVYILGASAFTALDYHKMFRSYEGKCYRFGYFPKHLTYDPDALMEKKKELAKGVPTILWMGRMLRLKHPELVVRALGILKAEGYDFTLRMIGEGEEREKIEKLVTACGLQDRTRIDGFLKPQEARDAMADAMIYVMTSNKLEGWGSVIYEAQNAGCAQIASHACGATPWLVRHGETGLVFQSGSAKDLALQLKTLLDAPDLIETYGRKAYEQMQKTWNPKTAAERVIGLCEYIEEELEKRTEAENRKAWYAVPLSPYADGPCAKAGFLKNNWIRERV